MNRIPFPVLWPAFARHLALRPHLVDVPTGYYLHLQARTPAPAAFRVRQAEISITELRNYAARDTSTIQRTVTLGNLIP